MTLTVEQITRRLERVCAWCERSYSPTSNVQKFCGRDCKAAHRRDADRRNREKVVCGCGTAYTRQRRTSPNPVTCFKCRASVGAENGNFKGGLHLSEGRWRICCRDGSFVLYYRAVMEAELKRPLLPDETVHHINGDCSDDRLENLQLLDRAAHGRIHGRERWL